MRSDDGWLLPTPTAQRHSWDIAPYGERRPGSREPFQRLGAAIYELLNGEANMPDDESWLLPTPTAREAGKGSHGRMHPKAPRRKDSIRNLDLSAIVRLIVSRDPRVMLPLEGAEIDPETF